MSETIREVLSAMAAGQRGRICGFDLPGEQRQRLLEMGLTIGTEFELVRFAPLGDPLELKVRGYNRDSNYVKLSACLTGSGGAPRRHCGKSQLRQKHHF
jgi:ferrous iron transport protein A